MPSLFLLFPVAAVGAGSAAVSAVLPGAVQLVVMLQLARGDVDAAVAGSSDAALQS